MVWEKVAGCRNLNSELIKKKPVLKTKLRKILGKKISLYLRYFKDRNAMKARLSKPFGHKQMQKCEKIAIIFIGTKDFVKFVPRYYLSFKKFFLPKTKKYFFIFTDRTDYPFLQNKKDIIPVKIKHENNSFATLFRFKYIDKIASRLNGYSHIIYIDADMYANQLITEKEFFSHNNPLFGVQHPYYVSKMGQFEFNPISTAAVKKSDNLSIYWQGCFWGGKRDSVLKLTKELDKRVNTDLKNKIIAKWLDESHLNKYFIENANEVYTYPPNYAYSDKFVIPAGFKRKIIHSKGNILDKK